MMRQQRTTTRCATTTRTTTSNDNNNNYDNNNNNSNKKNNKNNNNEDVLLEAYFRGQPPPTRLETQRVIQALLSPPTTDASSSTAKATRTPTKITTTVPQDMQAAAYGEGPLILSDIPQSILDLIKQQQHHQQQNHRGGTTTRGVIVGIDEAGRGSVLGPMVYGAAYWLPPNDDDDTEPNGHNSDDSLHVFADSKQLTPEKRNFLWNRYLLGTNCGTAKDHQSQEPPSSSSSPSSRIGFAIRILTASEISRNMLRSPTPYNLNQMSHGAAIQLIQQLLRVGIPIAHVFIDTVGDAAHYKRQLQQVFASSQDMEFTVEAKADATYPPCQAASVVAKVLRDALVQHHDPPSSMPSQAPPKVSSQRMGSGYPSDPTCQAWIKEHSVQCPVFGFAADAAPLVRFSWKPIVHLFQPPAPEPKKPKPTTTTRTVGNPTAAKIRFAADDEEDNQDNNHSQEQKRQRLSLQSFLLSGQSNITNNTAQRYPYFVQKGLRTVSELG